MLSLEQRTYVHLQNTRFDYWLITALNENSVEFQRRIGLRSNTGARELSRAKYQRAADASPPPPRRYMTQ